MSNQKIRQSCVTWCPDSAAVTAYTTETQTTIYTFVSSGLLREGGEAGVPMLSLAWASAPVSMIPCEQPAVSGGLNGVANAQV